MPAGPVRCLGVCRGILEQQGMVAGVTDLEIEEAIREAWAVLHSDAAASSSARRLAAALLVLTGGTSAHPHWVTPDDLWRDRLVVLADQGAWLAGGLDRASRIAGCRAPCCRNSKRGARTPMSSGARWCGPERVPPMRAIPKASRHHAPVAGRTPNMAALPARRGAGAKRARPNSSLGTDRIDRPGVSVCPPKQPVHP